MAWKWSFFKIECFTQRKHAVYKFIKVPSEVQKKIHFFFLFFAVFTKRYRHQSVCFYVGAYHLYFWNGLTSENLLCKFLFLKQFSLSLSLSSTKGHTILLIYFFSDNCFISKWYCINIHVIFVWNNEFQSNLLLISYFWTMVRIIVQRILGNVRGPRIIFSFCQITS